MIRLVSEQAVTGESGIILVRSKLRAVSQRMGFSAVKREYIELAATEMLTNQQKYARGTGLLQIWEAVHPFAALDLFALDFGPGIDDLATASRDGYTTSGTLGQGLGAIRRLSQASAVYSLSQRQANGRPWHGVAVWARFSPERELPGLHCQVGAYLRAYHDAPFNGDCICVQAEEGTLRWLHMDGLGHGREAAMAVEGMADFVERDIRLDRLLDRVSSHLRGGRGAVGLAGEVRADGAVSLCGVGDMMAASVGSGGRQNIHFAPGILGHAHRSFVMNGLQLEPEQLLITASDGLRTRWTEETFPGLWTLHPQMVALLLGNTVGRSNDDKSVFALRVGHEEGKANGDYKEKAGCAKTG